MKLVLIVDDDNDIRQNISAAVKLYNFQTISASSGKEAIELLRDYKVDIIISDMRMLFLEGCHFLHYIKENKNKFNKPIIFTTAKVDDRNIVDELKLEHVFFVSKPFRIAELIELTMKLEGDEI